jgi:hypothetical protein
MELYDDDQCLRNNAKSPCWSRGAVMMGGGGGVRCRDEAE